jgi:Flp pilus assembly protein TadG
MTEWKRMCSQEQGSSLVELALVLFVLVLLVMGVIDLGRAFHDYIVITNASREGARYASRFPSDSTGIISTARQEAANNRLDPDDIAVGITGLGATAGEPIRVTTIYNSQTILGGFVHRPNLTLERSTEMVVFGVED